MESVPTFTWSSRSKRRISVICGQKVHWRKWRRRIFWANARSKSRKATGGYPIYTTHPLRELTLAQAESLSDPEKWRLAENLHAGTNLAIRAYTQLTKTNLARIAALKQKSSSLLVFHTPEKREFITGFWNEHDGRYDPYTKTNKPGWLPAQESPAVTERLEKVMVQIEQALPNILALTNQITAVLSNSVNLTSNLSALAAEARPAATNFACLSAQLRGPGALGEWMLGTHGPQQVGDVLGNANFAITHVDTNLASLVENFARSLDNLSDITSNLNAQVQSNTNMLSQISDAVVHADQFVQGLKRHWLLRSAFRDKTNQPSSVPRLLSPKEQGQR